MVGANLLLYMNQSSSSVGFALNSSADTSNARVAVRQPPGLVISMDCSQAAFLSEDHLLVVLRTGDIYSLTLMADGVRGIRNILFEKTTDSVLPSCVREGVGLPGGGVDRCGLTCMVLFRYVEWDWSMCLLVHVSATPNCWGTVTLAMMVCNHDGGVWLCEGEGVAM